MGKVMELILREMANRQESPRNVVVISKSGQEKGEKNQNLEVTVMIMARKYFTQFPPDRQGNNYGHQLILILKSNMYADSSSIAVAFRITI